MPTSPGGPDGIVRTAGAGWHCHAVVRRPTLPAGAVLAGRPYRHPYPGALPVGSGPWLRSLGAIPGGCRRRATSGAGAAPGAALGAAPGGQLGPAGPRIAREAELAEKKGSVRKKRIERPRTGKTGCRSRMLASCRQYLSLEKSCIYNFSSAQECKSMYY